MNLQADDSQVQLEPDVSARPVDLLCEKFNLALRIAWKLPDDNTPRWRGPCASCKGGRRPWGR